MENITNDKVLRLKDRGPEALLIDEDDKDWAIETNRKITRFGTTPVAVIGIILNCVVIYAWTKVTPTFKPTFFLFKVLAVVDNIFVFDFVVWWYCDPNSFIGKLSYLLAFATLNVVVNVTLLVAISRWITLRFPLKFDILLSRFRVRLALGIVLIYCFIPRTVYVVLRFFTVGKEKRIMNMGVVCDQIFIALPIILQVGLSAHLLWMTFTFSGRVSCVKSEMSAIYSRSSSQSFLSRRMTLTVVSITITAFVAYPVGISIIDYFQITEIKAHASVKRIVLACINLLQVWNSSINFFFYAIYMPEFRKTVLTCFYPVLKKINSGNSKPDLVTETCDMTAPTLRAVSQGTEQIAGAEDTPNNRGNEQHTTAEETPNSGGTKHHTSIDDTSKD